MRDYSNIVDLANLRGLMGPVVGLRGPKKPRQMPDRYLDVGPVPVAAGMFGGLGQSDGLAAVSTGAAIAGTAVILALNFLFMAYASKIGSRWAGCGR